jgi:hypothetical protein
MAQCKKKGLSGIGKFDSASSWRTLMTEGPLEKVEILE